MAMTLRTDETLDAALTELAERHRMSKQEIVRAAVLEKAERESLESRLADSSARMRAKWSETLDRLGSV